MSLTAIGSWARSYHEGNICPPTARHAALGRLPSACRGDTGKRVQICLILPANPSHPACRSALAAPDPGAGSSHVSAMNPAEIPPNSTKGKEITLGQKLALWPGAASLDAPQPFWKRSCCRCWGKAESLHCLSKSSDSKEAGLSRRENE